LADRKPPGLASTRRNTKIRIMLDLTTPPVAFLDGLDDILIGPVPVGALPVAHHLPHHDTEAPGVLENKTSIKSHILTEKKGVPYRTVPV
jgi:hypothetical protein